MMKKPMSEDERDAHFAGFARALWHELMYVHEAGWIDVSDDGMNEEDEQRYRQIIARRAYDLVQHTVLHVDPHDLDALSYEEIPARIPDMDKWSE